MLIAILFSLELVGAIVVLLQCASAVNFIDVKIVISAPGRYKIVKV